MRAADAKHVPAVNLAYTEPQVVVFHFDENQLQSVKSLMQGSNLEDKQSLHGPWSNIA